MLTERDKVHKEIRVLISSGYPIIQIISWEQHRVLKGLISMLKDNDVYYWTGYSGLNKLSLSENLKILFDPIPTDETILPYIMKYKGKAVFILQDFHLYMFDQRSNTPVEPVLAALRHFVESEEGKKKTIVFLGPTQCVPLELQKSINIVDYPLPAYNEIAAILSRILTLAEKKFEVNRDKDLLEKIIKASLGLTYDEIERLYKKVIIEDKKFDSSDIIKIIENKKQIIRQKGYLEYFNLEEGLKDVGGMDLLKAWLDSRKNAFTEDARKFGLPQPKGILLIGVQGAGKSLAAKAIGSFWGLPLIRLDVGAVMEKWIGESERNIRDSIKIAESISPAILWIDELEKSFPSTRNTEGDSGTSLRIFSTFLNWMQEKTKPVFVVATANDISGLPPEFIRKGRFDEIFFVDLPKAKERAEIFNIHFNKRN